jgi:outer membrane lipoprotein-sorting protein
MNIQVRFVICLFIFAASSSASWAQHSDPAFPNDPQARGLYDKMVATIGKAKTLSWRADYVAEYSGKLTIKSNYRIWMQKPNYARIETFKLGSTTPTGILVLDGKTMWAYWPGGKPRLVWENKGKFAEQYAKYSKVFFVKKVALAGQHSLGHEFGQLGVGIAMSILDPSIFHGYTDSLQPYIDSVRYLNSEKIGKVECDVIDISFMKHQRSWNIWIAKKDCLPRKVKQVVRVNTEIVMVEEWSDVAINTPIPKQKFVWSPPRNWKEWREPNIEEGLLSAGTPAPNFELTSIDGSKIKLSDYKGKIVWLNFWRAG